MSSHYQVCRKLRVDIHGDILFSSKPILYLFKTVYPPRRKRDRNFVLRIDRLRPTKRKKRISSFVLQKSEKMKFEAFYHIKPSRFRMILRRQKKIQGNAIQQLFFYLESQIHIILWRLQFFHRFSVRKLLYSSKVFCNFSPINCPSYHVSPGDFITIYEYPHLLRERLQKGWLRLRERHLFIDYSLLCVIPLYYPTNPFLFFKYDLSFIAFSPRYR